MKNGKILLVEDDPAIRELTKRALEKNNIFNEVVITEDGAEALDYLFGIGAYAERDVRIMPVVVLLDLQLPKVHGLEVLRRLRANERTKLLPVVILTSSQKEQDRLDSYKLGANSYVQKPVDFDEFVNASLQLWTYWLLLNKPPPSAPPTGGKC